MTDLLQLSALAQAELVRSGRLSSVELTRFYQDRVERLNGSLHAFVTCFGERALARAQAADRKAMSKSRRRPLPVFHGVPTGVKDLDPVRRSFTRMGSRVYSHLWTPLDGPVARRLRRAGFVFMGKLATSELGAMPVTEPDIHAPSRNPWNLEHSPGGSSGGSGAAVASGMLPIAQGSDGAGSIRIPSSFSHLFGLKPSRGVHPNFYRALDRYRLVSVGPLAHTVDDAVAMVDTLAGYTSVEPHPDSLRARSRRDPGALRVYFGDASPLGRPVHPARVAAVHAVARTLESLGHEVERGVEVGGDLDEFVPVYQWQMAHMPVLRESLLQPAVRWLRTHGKRVATQQTDELVRALTTKVNTWYGDADLWLLPTVAQPPPRVGAWRDMSPEEQFTSASALGDFTAAFNVSGHAGVNIPAGLDDDGLPVGVQLVARPGRDATLVAVARQLEQAMPWRGAGAPSAWDADGRLHYERPASGEGAAR